MNSKENGNKKILITGGSGMVGKNLIDVFLKEKKYIIYYPNRQELDLTDFESTKDYIGMLKPDYIIHAAGRVGGIQANIKYPLDFIVENIDIGRNIILAAKINNISRLLNLGSSCMYPRNIDVPMKENLILNGELEPTNEGYALAKIISTKLCEYVSNQAHKFQYKTIIPCNLYGKFDNFSIERSHLIPSIIYKIDKAVENNSNTVEIWGDGSIKREFMYAKDLAEAISLFINDFDQQPLIMNIGCGKDYTIKEYYETAAKIIGYRGKFKYNLSMPTGMKRKIVNIDKQKTWGWMPQTELEEGIRLSYNYYKDSVKR